MIQTFNRRRRYLGPATAFILLVLAAAVLALAFPRWAPGPFGQMAADLTGANPRPLQLMRPTSAPLSSLALLGQKIFYDPSLSASGLQSCASCHSPQHAYGPPNGRSVQLGGPKMILAGIRPPPSLTYLYRQGPFSIGPDPGETDNPVPLNQTASQAAGTSRAAKSAAAASLNAVVPQAGLFWDGRSNTLQMQASGPMLDPAEMANASEADVARKLARTTYANLFAPLFGASILQRPSLLVAEAMSAVSRYQIEDPAFHRFDSKYDAWLEGRARLTPAERRGIKLFNDPAKANCGGCHLSRVSRDRLPPLFTDTQYEALGTPRNPLIPANKDPHFFDLGLCGPIRKDLATQTQYCGMFLTPTLRNSSRRGVYFHNGVYHTLEEVIRFYNFRDTRPNKIYPLGPSGAVDIYNDIPKKYRANVDVTDAPFDRKANDAPVLSDQDMADIIAFLKTLDDGFGGGITN